MKISDNTRIAYAELNSFIELLSEEDRDMIPEKFLTFIRKEMNKNYVKTIDPDVPIKDQNLKSETLALIAILYLNYICDDEEEKKKLKEIFKKNECNYQKYLKEHSDLDCIFNKEIKKQ